MAGAGGFEPPNAGTKTLCLAAWRRPSTLLYLTSSFSEPAPSETGPFSSRTIQVKVTGLGDPDEPMIDDMYGIICEAQHERRSIELPLDELEVKKHRANRQLVEDYSYWLHNWS